MERLVSYQLDVESYREDDYGFMGVIQMRHPGELGGFYRTATTFLALLASFVCVWVGDGGTTE